jgi:hypothetical protein
MVDNRDGSIIATSKEQAPQERCGASLSRGAIVMAIAEQTSVRIASVRIVIGVAVAAPVVIVTVIASPITKTETPVVIEMSDVIEVTAPGKVLTCKSMAEAAQAAAHMATTESAAHMATTACTA